MPEMKDEFLCALYQGHYEKMIKIAYRSIGDMESAQDLVQQTFLWALLKREEFSSHPSPEGWLVITLRNLMRNEQRKLTNHPQVSLDTVLELQDREHPSPLEHILPKELLPEERQILIWRFEQQMSYREMADRLGISESGCRSRVHRALASCRKHLKLP